MAFRDIGQVREIDNELILFRELFNGDSDFINCLLISQGGRITQHLVEFLARIKGNIKYDIYDLEFKYFLEQCDFISDDIKDFIININKYRRNVVYSSEHENELNGLMLDFLEAFNKILNWFNKYCNKFYKDIKFQEINKTINLLENVNYIEKRSRKNELREINNKLDILVKSHERENEYREREIEQRNTIIQNQENIIIPNLEKQSQQHNEMNQKIDEDISISKDTNYNVKEFRKEFKEFREEFKKFHEDYKTNQEEVAEKLGKISSEEELDEIMWKFTKKQVEIIENCVKKTIATEDLNKQEQRLINSLKQENWDKLEENSKTFLTSSIITYYNIHDYEDDIDYSGVCLLVTKALEIELCKRFYKGFSNYLNKKYGKDYSKYHTALVGNYFKKNSKNYRLKKPRDCNLGRITHILCYAKDDRIKDEEIHQNNLNTIIEYSKLTYFKDLSDEEIQDKLYTYGKYVDDIRRDYRNPAAHTGELNKTKAKECFNYVLKVKRVLWKMLDSFDE